MNILVVDDDHKIRLLFEKQIHSLGHNVTSCSDAKSALELCQHTPYSIFILDLGLPDMDGTELCRRIRTLPQGKHSMILIVTGRDDPGDLEAVLEAGADDYLSKPVSFQQLKVRLTIIERRFHHLVRRKQAEKALQNSLKQIEQTKREWEVSADSLSHVICLLDRQGRIIRANRAIEYWDLGKVTEVPGQHMHALFHPHCQDAACSLKTYLLRAWEEVKQGKPAEYEIEDNYLQRCLRIQVRPVAIRRTGPPKKMETFAVLVADDMTSYRQLQEALSQQNRLLLGVARAMDHLLVTPDFQTAMLQALKALSLAIDVDRISIFETHSDPDTAAPLMSQRFEWDRFSDKARINNPDFQHIPYHIGFNRWYEVLNANKTINGIVRNLPAAEREMLTTQNIISILVVPITIQERFWGFIGFDDCRAERQWRDEEEALLIAVAGSIGGAIAREKAEGQLLQTSTELREVFQSLPDEYFRLGADGSVLDYKIAKGSELYLYSETFMGKWASGLLPDGVERKFDAAMAQVRQSKKLMSIEYRLPTSEQQQRYEEIRLLPFLDKQLLIVARDITKRKLAEEELRKHRDHLEELVQERTNDLTTSNLRLQQEILKRKHTEEALRELNQQLEEASQHKSQFLARMSHELRTPLNAMIGYTSLTLNALKEKISAKDLQNLSRAERSARGLLQLINDVLDFSKIEAGQMDMFIEPIDLGEIIEDVEIVAEGLLLGRSIEFLSETSSELPQVQGDYTKIKQILNNLIGNAIKFTREGYVAVRARPADDGKAVHIEVEDSGEGIPEEKIEHIFESFKQVDGSIKKRFGGTGLGLAITKKFCEMLGIEMQVHSQVGQGTTFHLKIPVQGPVSEQSGHEEVPLDIVATGESASLNYNSILVIDDDNMTLNLLEEIFATNGYTVYTAPSGAEGFQQALEKIPDVILTDLVLPDMSGFETIELFKHDARICDIPIIACSAVVTKEFQHKAKIAGCVGYITKPIEPERLVEQVKKYVSAGKK